MPNKDGKVTKMNKFDIWLSILKTTSKRKLELLKYYGSSENIYNDVINNKRFELKGTIKNIEQKEIQDIENTIYKNEIDMVNFNDENYPKALMPYDDAPAILYYKGNLEGINNNKSVAIVGSRNCSYYGQTVAEYFSRELTKVNINIISGVARGIDSFAHTQCIKHHGFTCGVLGCGIDVVYPSENSHLYNEIIKDGCLISEFPPGTTPFAYNFPIRNRIISGLSDIIIVIEAGVKSGSLITASIALEQGKEVFAVPGSIFSNSSKGTNKLIQDGANPATDINDIFEMLKVEYSEKTTVKTSRLSPLENKICKLITDNPIHIDDILKKTNVDINQLYGLLFELQFKNEIICLSGNYYVKSNYNI